MSIGTEQKIQKKIIDYLEGQGAYVIKVISASKAGVPDIHFCYEGFYGAIEVKTPATSNNVSKLQSYNLDCVCNAGGHAIVAWELEQVKDMLVRMLS
jgi:Holliday junction resolvase